MKNVQDLIKQIALSVLQASSNSLPLLNASCLVLLASSPILLQESVRPALMPTVWIVPRTRQSAHLAQSFLRTTSMVPPVLTVLLPITLAMTSVVPALLRATLSPTLESASNSVGMVNFFHSFTNVMMGIPQMEMDAAASV